jgi:translation initiation factor 4A
MEKDNKTNNDEKKEGDKDVNIFDETEMGSNWDETVENFDELNIKTDLLRGIFAYGFDKPSSIQQRAILPIIKGRDVIAQAQSGSGKTGCFVIGSLELIDVTKLEVQALILAPTRELAQQIYNVYTYIGEFLKIKVLNLIGGTQVRDSKNALENGVHVVVGSPGRVLDMLKKNHLKLAYLKCLILDEADDLLSKGFLENMKDIISLIPPECRINLFSATMPKEIVNLSANFMNDPAKILVKNEELTLLGIKQYYITLKKEWKLETLMNLYKGLDISQAIIFCNSINGTENLTTDMRSKGHKVSCIHSGLPMNERAKVMSEFRSGVTRVLISTDLTARGIDVYNVSIVINYDLPTQKETYIHRIGRSGRFGKKGNAINFILPEEKDQLDMIQKFYDTHIEQLPQDLSEIK